MQFFPPRQTVPVYKPRPSKSVFDRAGLFLTACIAIFAPMVAPAQDASTFAGKATPPGSLKIAPGFKVDLLHTVPKEQEGSWVAMCTDPKGRLIVSDQYGSLYRVNLPDVSQTDGLTVDSLDVNIGQAQGLLYAFDSLYVMVANDAYQGRGLYRLRDTTGDDQFDEVRLLKKLDGGGEHGPHAIVLSPDGESLHIIVGNQTRIPDIDSSLVPPHWSEDHLLPRLWDGNGFMRGVLGPGGWIARINPDGTHWELVATGFRNEYDAAFNRDGELFTFDADMEWDMNTPWYRPTRINHVQSGGEFGWRSGAGKWPAHYPDSLGSVVDIGPGSPTGVTFGYGAKFPAKYQEAFYASDWSYGKLYAVHLEPHGSGYRGVAEEFVSGSPLPLTDLVVNPSDGALYFAIGGRKTQSALYRVTYVGSESTDAAPRSVAGAAERALRHQLESFHGRAVVKDGPGRWVPAPWTPAELDIANENIDFIWPHLSHPDRGIRFAARVALEWQPVVLWRERALAETTPRAAIHASIALARSSARDAFHRKPQDPAVDPRLSGRVLKTLNRIDWTGLDIATQRDLLRAYSLTIVRLGGPAPSMQPILIEKFQPLFPAADPALNTELAQMLVRLEAPDAARLLVKALSDAPSQEEQLDLARILRTLRTGWTHDLRTTYFQWFVRAANFRGGSSLSGFLRDIKQDAIATLTPGDIGRLQAVLDAKPEPRKPLEDLLAGRDVVQKWKVEDLLPALETGLTKRNFDRGRTLFGAVGCYNCHRFATEGGATGPDLTGVGGRFNPRDLLESIIDPSKEVSDQYAPILVTKTDGDVVVGRIANLNEETLLIAVDMTDPNGFVGIKRSDIESIEASTMSPMPEGLLDTLNTDEILDLMAFLLSRGDRKAAMF